MQQGSGPAIRVTYITVHGRRHIDHGDAFRRAA